MPTDLDRIEGARRALGAASANRVERAAELGRLSMRLSALRRTHMEAHPLRVGTEEAIASVRASLGVARDIEAAARSELTRLLDAALEGPAAEAIAQLDAEYPIVLLPVRIETRFDHAAAQLKVRIYPDVVMADTHEPLLSENELADGQSFWRTAWFLERERDAWTALLSRADAPRAAWIVRQTTPTNLSARPSAEPQFPALILRATGWARGSEARGLPDRWTVIAYRGDTVKRAESRGVVEPLRLTLGSSIDTDSATPGAVEDLSGDGLVIDPEVAWTLDFDRAEAVGMAVRVALDVEDLKLGFDQLLVVGVKTLQEPAAGAEELGQLLESHHYSLGLEFVRQGTPTNNTSGIPSGFPPADPNGAGSFAIERGAGLDRRHGDGVRFARALGIPTEVVAHVGRADGVEQAQAAAMAEALWPVTWGYFLQQMMAPVFTRQAIREVRQHFVEWVRGRGPLPALRIGEVPYGVLPVSSLTGWQAATGATPTDVQLPEGLRRLRRIWSRQVSNVPRIGRTDDADTDLLETLGMDASSSAVGLRAVLGPDATRRLFQLYDAEPNEELQRRIAADVLARIGHPEWNPRVVWATNVDHTDWFAAGLVTDRPLSEEGRLVPNYISSIRWSDPSQLRQETDRLRPLLHRLLRHGYLLECADVVNRILLAAGLVDEHALLEPELVKFAPGTAERPTFWDHLNKRVGGVTGGKTLGEYVSPRDLRSGEGLAPRELLSYWRALDTLAEVPTAELERLLSETLDVCSHRLDAWITSLPTQRLHAMRERRPLGAYLGAYGWLENVRPAEPARRSSVDLGEGRSGWVDSESAGFMYAPSMAHGATAAVLRNASLSQRSDGAYAVDLSSARVRDALQLLDAVRNGQPLGAVLGYRFERGLHQGHPGRELDTFIEPFRRTFPLMARDGGAADAPTEQIGARDVVDGWALLKAWQAEQVPWGSAGLAPEPADRAVIELELGHLAEMVDGLTDLLMAESVFQLVNGKTEAAAATLDAMARGARPPQPQVATVPRGGIPLVHRFGVLLGGAPLAHTGWGDPPHTPRARVEPFLNAWVGSLLGDPALVRCAVDWSDPRQPATPVRHWVTLRELGIEPLDVVALAAAGESSGDTAELDLRVANAVAGAGDQSAVTIQYRWDGFDPIVDRSFPQVLEIARAINAVLGASRPLRAEDLLPPEERDRVPAEGRVTDAHELEERAVAAMADVPAVARRLENALRGAASGSAADVDALRGALGEVSLYGIRGAFPLARSAGAGALIAQAQTALRDLQQRWEAAQVAPTALEQIHALFGRDLLVLPRFHVPNPEEIRRALPGPVGADADAVGRWLHQLMRVRSALGPWRRLMLYGRANASWSDAAHVLQLPHQAEARWAALPFASEDDTPARGLVSLVLDRRATPGPDDPWVGLLVDEWTELIPNRNEDAGLVFQYDGPNAEAPHAILVAVPPTDAARWELNTLVEILRETAELARLRAVDADFLGELSQILPAVYLASNAFGDAVSTTFVDVVSTTSFIPTLRS